MKIINPCLVPSSVNNQVANPPQKQKQHILKKEMKIILIKRL